MATKTAQRQSPPDYKKVSNIPTTSANFRDFLPENMAGKDSKTYKDEECDPILTGLYWQMQYK